MRYYLAFLIVFLASPVLQAKFEDSCYVTTHEDSGSGSLREAVNEFNHDRACFNILFRKLPAPMRVTLKAPLWLQGSALWLTGYDYAAEHDLDVVVDARAVGDNCALRIFQSELNVVEHLSIYVANDPRKALCDADGRSLIDKKSPAYSKQYDGLRICSGANATECTSTPLVSKDPEPEAPDNDDEPKPHWPPRGPTDLKYAPQPCADNDKDGVCNSKDKCQLVGSAAAIAQLKSVMYLQCPEQFPQNGLQKNTNLRNKPRHGDHGDVSPELCHQDLDEDNDGLGNACDLDADNDGYDFSEELAAGTDPLDEKSFPPAPGTDTGTDGADSGDTGSDTGTDVGDGGATDAGATEGTEPADDGAGTADTGTTDGATGGASDAGKDGTPDPSEDPELKGFSCALNRHANGNGIAVWGWLALVIACSRFGWRRSKETVQ